MQWPEKPPCFDEDGTLSGTSLLRIVIEGLTKGQEMHDN